MKNSNNKLERSKLFSEFYPRLYKLANLVWKENCCGYDDMLNKCKLRKIILVPEATVMMSEIKY